jgi:hypothetical protein
MDGRMLESLTLYTPPVNRKVHRPFLLFAYGKNFSHKRAGRWPGLGEIPIGTTVRKADFPGTEIG